MAMSLKSAAIGVSASGILFVIVLPLASQSGGGQQLQTQSAGVSQTVFSGGALEGVRKVAENNPTTTTSQTYVNVPGAGASWFVAANDSDLLNVNFTAECRLIGNAAPPTGAANWVEIRVMLVRGGSFVGFMQPNDTGSPMAFCSANEYAMHSANFAARVSGGTAGATYTAQVQYKVSGASGLTAWLDDYMTELLAFN
jgi:hypothetical protein